MRRLAEFEELARMARQQASVTTNHETRQVLDEMASKYAEAADERRVALADGRIPPSNTRSSA